MQARTNPTESSLATATRRQFFSWGALALTGAAMATSSARATVQSPASSAKPGASDSATSLHQEVDFVASSQNIYQTLLDSKKFAAFTGAPAEINPEAGGAFSCFGGLIVGRNIELKPNELIVQAWRVAAWPAGVYSIAKFELKPQASGTHLTFDHSGFPVGAREHLEQGWKAQYWDPLQKYLAKAS